MNIRIRLGDPALRKRPISLRAWARLAGLNLLGVGGIVLSEGETFEGATFLAIGVALIVVWMRVPSDSRFEPTFPYAYVADLPAQPEPARTPAQRLARASVLAAAVGLAWVVFDPGAVVTAAAAAWFVGVWTYEEVEPLTARARRTALLFGIGAALWFGVTSLLLSSGSARRSLSSMLLGGMLAYAVTSIAAGINAGMRRTPHRMAR
jgi:hypothetical protein